MSTRHPAEPTLTELRAIHDGLLRDLVPCAHWEQKCAAIECQILRAVGRGETA